jgi:cell division protein FtsB
MKIRRWLITLSLFILATFSFAFLGKEGITNHCKVSSDKKSNEKQPESLPETSLFNPLNRLVVSI